MIFEDRISAYPNRYKMINEDGTATYVLLERADDPIAPGTPLNAENMNNLLQKSGDTMDGPINMNGNRIIGLPTPTEGSDAITRDFALSCFSNTGTWLTPDYGFTLDKAFANGGYLLTSAYYDEAADLDIYGFVHINAPAGSWIQIAFGSHTPGFSNIRMRSCYYGIIGDWKTM